MSDNITLPREVVEKALRRAFYLGQNYWRDADSDSRAAHKRADKHLQDFDALCSDVLARTALAAEPTKPVVISKDWLKMTLRVNRGDRVLKVERWLHLSEIKQSRFPLVKATADSAWQELDAAMKEDKT